MGRPIATKVYDLYGRFYDRFEVIFKKRLAKAIGAVPLRPNDRVLDVGIGTGLSLEFYPDCVHVTGIDLSAGMLAQAQRKIDEGRVRAECGREATVLVEGDAMKLPFGDGEFDAVVLSHVVSTVPDAERCLREAIRVAREGASIVIVNHFRTQWPVVNWVESAIDPICRKLGWRSDLSLEGLLESVGVEREAGEHGEGFLFRIVYLRKYRSGVRMVAAPEMVEGMEVEAA